MPATANLPEVWRAAVDDLSRSTAEPGHPWSCAGGTIDLELAVHGAVLRVAREGEETVSRQVTSPADVLPLGQALLAMPLAPSTEIGQPTANVAPVDPREAKPAQPFPKARPDAIEATTEAGPTKASKPSRRLLLAAGVDARHVGGSNVAWVGPTVSAGLAMGRWLPSISFRQQSSIFLDGPPIDELSVAIAVQARFEISSLELRAGLTLRGATVQRDLPRPRGEQSRLEARIGLVAAVAVPVFRWANVVFSADGDVVGAKRETDAAEPTSGAVPASFPKYTLGGSACLEVPL